MLGCDKTKRQPSSLGTPFRNSVPPYPASYYTYSMTLHPKGSTSKAQCAYISEGADDRWPSLSLS